VFSPSAESELPEKHGGEGIEPNSGESRVVTGVALLGIIASDPCGDRRKLLSRSLDALEY
jgi:hypothetical protein